MITALLPLALDVGWGTTLALKTIIVLMIIPLGEMGYYIASKGATGPFRVKIRSASFSNVSILPWLLRGVYIPDIITILASLYFILGDIDR